MQTKRMLKDEIVKLKYRVAELEERLCPCEEHDWKKVGEHFIYDMGGGCVTSHHYKCCRCGKYVEGAFY